LEIDLTSIVAFLVGVLAVARVTRLIVDDDWPPIVWLREWYVVDLCKGNKWGELVGCSFCMSTWVGLPWLLAAWASGLAWWWWVPSLWMGGSYLAAMVNVRDVPSD
jgi:hypothetical protein